MGFLGNLFRKKAADEATKVGGIEDFMTLIRVYYQAVMASNLGISNINMLPDLAMFKRTLKVATQNNKLGVAEKSRCKKMLYTQTEAAISNILTKNNWKDEAMFKTVGAVRQLQQALGYSSAWMTDFVFNVIRLAKKEPKKKDA